MCSNSVSDASTDELAVRAIGLTAAATWWSTSLATHSWVLLRRFGRRVARVPSFSRDRALGELLGSFPRRHLGNHGVSLGSLTDRGIGGYFTGYLLFRGSRYPHRRRPMRGAVNAAYRQNREWPDKIS
jgi:hypothetical protein